MTVFFINGPNLNMLGTREPEIYGAMTLTDIEDKVKAEASILGFETEFFQSNHEGDIVDKIQNIALQTAEKNLGQGSAKAGAKTASAKASVNRGGSAADKASGASEASPRNAGNIGNTGNAGSAVQAVNAIVINAGAYTHTSVAIHDALKNFDGVIIELHISNPMAREAFRHTSYIAPVATAVICGFGWRGYLYALRALKDMG